MDYLKKAKGLGQRMASLHEGRPREPRRLCSSPPCNPLSNRNPHRKKHDYRESPMGRRKPTIYLIVGVEGLIQDGSVTLVVLVPQELHLLLNWEVEESLALIKDLVHQLLADPVVHYVEKPRILACLRRPTTSKTGAREKKIGISERKREKKHLFQKKDGFMNVWLGEIDAIQVR